jgi:hypothetical protein
VATPPVRLGLSLVADRSFAVAKSIPPEIGQRTSSPLTALFWEAKDGEESRIKTFLGFDL